MIPFCTFRLIDRLKKIWKERVKEFEFIKSIDNLFRWLKATLSSYLDVDLKLIVCIMFWPWEIFIAFFSKFSLTNFLSAFSCHFGAIEMVESRVWDGQGSALVRRRTWNFDCDIMPCQFFNILAEAVEKKNVFSICW